MDLHIFRTVVKAGGITRAAQQLHRVQSNVTTRIRQLEEELGVSLFVREGKRLRLSPAGQILLGYAERISSLVEQARQALHDDKPRGRLRLGSMESTAAVRLPAVLGAFQTRYPGVGIELRTGAPQALAVQVLSGELDAAFYAEPVEDSRLDARTAFEEELVIIASAKHPPISRARDIAGGAVLAFHPGCPHRLRLEDWFRRDGVLIERLIEVTSYHAILGCAVVGMGASLVPRSVLASFAGLNQLSVHPLKGKFARAKTMLVWRKGAPQPNVEALAAMLPA